MSEIIRRAGGLVKLAKAAGRHHATILGWTRVPPQHVKAVSFITGIPAHQLRPDLWDPPDLTASKSEPVPPANDTPKSSGRAKSSKSKQTARTPDAAAAAPPAQSKAA